MSGAGRFFSRLRRPEFTGENRCRPCTVLNVGLAAVGSLNLWLLFAIAGYQEVGVPVSAGCFALALASIWLRGYLVPGTPVLTERYLPAAALAAFGKGGSVPVASGLHGVAGAERAGTDDWPPDRDAAAVLDAAGTIDRGSDGDAELTEAFRTAWLDAIEAARTGDGSDRHSDDRLRDRFGLDGDAVTLDERSTAVVARVDGQRVGTWASRAAFEADLAVAELLADRVEDWSSLSPAERGALCWELRGLLETCPVCRGSLVSATETRESCCSSWTVVSVSCEDCATLLFESAADESDQ